MEATRDSIGIDFLRNEVGTASVFARIATDAEQDNEKKVRNRHRARRVYDTLLRFANQLVLTADEHDEMRKNLTDLHRQLMDLGENF